jgi:hypothetical protein
MLRLRAELSQNSLRKAEDGTLMKAIQNSMLGPFLTGPGMAQPVSGDGGPVAKKIRTVLIHQCQLPKSDSVVIKSVLTNPAVTKLDTSKLWNFPDFSFLSATDYSRIIQLSHMRGMHASGENIFPRLDCFTPYLASSCP